MDVNKILTADILDIVFEGRNKEYGAYELRKTYDHRIKYALVVTVALCVLLLLGSFLANQVSKGHREVQVQDVTLTDVRQQEEKKPDVPPPPPPPKMEPPKVELAKFTPPVITKDQDVKPEEEMKTVDELKDTKIGSVNQEGVKDEGLTPPPNQPTVVAETPKKEEDYDQVFQSVQIQASYKGGEAAWIRYLERNLNTEVPKEQGAPPGRYTVVLNFIVDKTGNISDIIVENDPGYGVADEAIRVLKKAGGWTPGQQNGRIVASRHRQAITFQITEADN